MDKKHRERGDNWTAEEKNIVMEIMKQSALIIEDKRTDTNTNKRKEAEWLKVQKQYRELTGKHRDISQLKGFWRRAKMAAKRSVSNHKRALRATGGGQRPPSPTEEVQTIMQMCPTDFIEEKNEFDSDGIFEKDDATQDMKVDKKFTILSATEDCTYAIIDIEEDEADGNNSVLIEETIIDNINDPNTEIVTKQTALSCISKKENINNNVQTKKLKTTGIENTKKHKADASHKNLLIETNIQLKEKTFKLMEEEYAFKIKYQKRELSHQELRHKFEIDILLQEKEKKAIEINILKKQLL